jgi:hypothetical protein
LLDDVTVEHLLSQADGGTNKLANLVLTHKERNEEAADLPIVEKVRPRDRLRSKSTQDSMRINVTIDADELKVLLAMREEHNALQSGATSYAAHCAS